MKKFFNLPNLLGAVLGVAVGYWVSALGASAPLVSLSGAVAAWVFIGLANWAFSPPDPKPSFWATLPGAAVAGGLGFGLGAILVLGALSLLSPPEEDDSGASPQD